MRSWIDCPWSTPGRDGTSSRMSGYGARRLCRIIEAAKAGRDPQTEPLQDRAAEIALGVTLPTQALRNLFKHTEVHLNVEWRDLTDADWDLPAVLPDGTRATLRRTAAFRARDIWLRSVELGLGGTYDDLPPDLRADMSDVFSVSIRA